MNLQKGQKLANGFGIIDIVDLAEIGSTGIWARHEASGAEVFHILNDDSENLFSFAFATAPEDDTGVAHILEHIVLCGSKNYPLKDVFLELYQGSLQTSLNAMTSPDKTYYPASSINEHDYFNLMSIYGDAVFRPLLSRWAFLQEGCRREIVKSEDGTEKLAITGVVYNEMKGAYSSLETYAGYWSLKAVLPDTPYAFEFGGNPESIPDLDWEALKEFHRKRYSPANCRIFLAGNIPTERQLDFLAEKFFSTTAETGMRMPPVARQPRWIKPREYEVDCPAGSDSKPTVFVSWLCGETADWTESVSLLLLTEILLGHDGSPLLKPLVESGLGEDLTPVSGLERELAETVFTVGLQGVPLENKPKVEALIFEELARIAKEGIPKDDLEAALLALEFSQREIKRAGGPFSFVWMRRSFRGWMHGRAPWETLLFEPAMAEIKTRLAADPTYFEKLISRYLLENPHRALVTIKPEADFVARQEAALEEKLARTLASLTAGEKRAILDDGIELERIQGEEESDEALASIPHLSRKDLIPEVERIPRREEDLKGIPALCHELHTNGISYVKLAFPLDLLPEEDYPWFPFFCRAATSVGLPGMDYAEVSGLLARNTGGLGAMLHTGSATPGSAGRPLRTAAGSFDLSGRDWLMYGMKCLDEKADFSLDLLLRLIEGADFSDHRRLRDLVLELKNAIDSGIAPHGSRYASFRAELPASRASRTGETWNGISQVLFVHRLAAMDIAEVAGKLESLRRKVVSGGLIVDLAGSAAALAANGRSVADRFSRFGPPKPGNAVPEKADSAPAPVCEVFASPSLQVGFAAMALRSSEFGSPASLAESVAGHHLSSGALWEEIRMKGGAYGADAGNDSLERCFCLSTYRDPSPLRSLEAFPAILSAQAENGLAEDDLVKTLVGYYAKEVRPRSPAEKSMVDFMRFLSRIDHDYRIDRLKKLAALTPADLSRAMETLAAEKPLGRAVLTGMKDAEQTAKVLGVEVQELPA